MFIKIALLSTKSLLAFFGYKLSVRRDGAILVSTLNPLLGLQYQAS
jgi:hypothetical protein